jgi:peptide/nickel transport system permease protein
MLPLLILVSVISFGLIQVMPGDYLTRARMNPQITQETLNQMMARYGLDKPFYVQYWLWFKQIITKGNFGTSFETMRPVYWTLFMGDRFMWTIIIASTTMLLTWLIAIPLGIYSATHQYKPSDHTLTFFVPSPTSSSRWLCCGSLWRSSR